MKTGLRDPLRALKLHYAHADSFSLGYDHIAVDGVARDQKRVHNSAQDQFLRVAELLSFEAINTHGRAIAKKQLDPNIAYIERVWLGEASLSDGLRRAVEEYVKDVKHLRPAFFGGWRDRMCPMLVSDHDR